MYISISGNTGAGKSTLGKALAKAISTSEPIEYIDETTFHHSYLQKMFERPNEYSLMIQMNFLLERTLKIRDLIENTRKFLIERSLLDDYLFAKRHMELGHISDKEFEVYHNFWQLCYNQIPMPCGLIYLQCKDSLVLTNRVIEGYKADRRNQELPDDELFQFVTDLNKRYEDWFRSEKRNKIICPIFTDSFENSNNFISLVEFSQNSLHSD